MIVTGGGLTKTGNWIVGGEKFFIPVKVMAKKFRGKFLCYLKSAKLRFEGSQKYLEDDWRFILIASLFPITGWYR